MPFFGDTKDVESAAEWKVFPSGPVDLVITPRRGVILTAGSDLNQFVAPSGDMQNPWPWTFSAAVRRMANNWKALTKRTVEHHNTPANFGGHGSVVKYSFVHREFDDGVGNAPGGYNGGGALIPMPKRPMYNNLVPIVYGIRDVDLTAQAAAAELVQIQVLPLGPVDFTTAGNASLQESLL